jgi:hypothetical protein
MICAAVEHCAGIDVGKKCLSVCSMIGPLDGEPRVERHRFGVNVADLQQLRGWLSKEGVTHAVMESTGSYWKPVFNVLEDSVKVYLANPHEVKKRKGTRQTTRMAGASRYDPPKLDTAAPASRVARPDAPAGTAHASGHGSMVRAQRKRIECRKCWRMRT